MTDAMEQALDVAVDALCRRARILDGQDPEVAAALRELAATLEHAPPRFFTPKDRVKQAAAQARWRKAKGAHL